MPLILGTNSIKDTGYDVANSLRFNIGSTDYLNRTSGTSSNTNVWSLSMWIKRSDVSSSGSQKVFSAGSGSTDRTEIYFGTDDKLNIFRNISGSEINIVTSMVFKDPSSWYHTLWVWNGTAITLYVNGASVTLSATNLGTNKINGSSTVHRIGIQHDNSSQNFGGYLAEVTFLDGTAVSDATSFGEFDSDSPNIWKPKNVSGLTFGNNGFYLDFENNQTAFIDSSSNARAITVSGNTNHSFTQAKFNESSIYFDGTNDSLDIADSSDFDFGTGNFTFEFWVYKTGSGKMAIFETRPNGGNDHGFNLEFDASNKFSWYDASISGTLPTDPNAITLNTWTHYACVRNGTTFTMYKNGTSVGTPLTGDSSSQSSDGTPTIGESSAGSNDFQGYLDEIRLSNTARYTGNFTAPTSPFTSDSDTVLLIQSKASNLIGADVSGQGNHFSSSGLTSIDQSTDTCTNNFATLNPLATSSFNDLSEGSLKITGNTATNDGETFSTFVMPNATAKWYWELKCTNKYSGGNPKFGFIQAKRGFRLQNGGAGYGGAASGTLDIMVRPDGKTLENGSTSGSAVIGTWDTGDILSFALDSVNGAFYVGINGTWQTSGNPESGASKTGAVKTWTPTDSKCDDGQAVCIGSYNGSVTEANFGSPSFAISSGNTDADGHGNMEFSVPSGYFVLNSKNLAEYG